MILAATGHRPDKLGGYSDEALAKLVEFAAVHIARLDPNTVISGMAQGWDTAVALACIESGVPLIAAKPFLGQAAVWPFAAQQRHAFILSKASKIYVVCDGGYAPRKMQKRNEWMVDVATEVLALWNGSPGGTANCIAYAEAKNKPVENLWGEWARA